MRSAALTLAALSLAFAYAVFQNAGVTPAIGVVSALYFAIPVRSALPRVDRATATLLSALLAIAVLQILPLPTSLVAILSPQRVELLRATEPVLGPAPSWTTLSVVPWQTLQYLLNVGGYILVFLLLRELSIRLSHRAYTWAPVWPLLMVAALEGALGLYQVSLEGAQGFAHGTYANRDHYAGLLELVLPFAILYPVALVQRDRHRFESSAGPALKAGGILACATLILIGIVYSLSRMAFLATLASLFVAGSMALRLRGAPIERPIGISVWRRLLPTAAVALIVLLGFTFLPTDRLIARFADLARTDDITADTRAQIWRDSASLVKAFPVFGCGLGGYESCFLRYKTVAPLYTVNYAHNDYLQVLAEMGSIGFGLAFVLLLRVLYSAVRGALYARSIDDRYLSIACIASLTAIMLHSFVDFNMYRPANAFAVCWIAGIAATRLRMIDLGSCPGGLRAYTGYPLHPTCISEGRTSRTGHAD